VDSGCSTHLTNCKNLLRQQSSDQTEITIADEKSITSSLKVTIYGKNVVLSNVLYCKELDHSLLSVARLTENGYGFMVKGGILTISTEEGRL
jgi:hypothetical protein